LPGTIYQVGASAICPHGGQIQAVSTNTRVMLSGMPATTASDTFTIAGCAFNVSSAPSPCLTVKWLVPATRVKVGGQFVILQTSTGLCQSGAQAPQGPPNVTSTQTKVTAQ
jgi:hypothetical protein